MKVVKFEQKMWVELNDHLKALEFARQAATIVEREECAKLIERDDSMRWSGAADAIRARGNHATHPTGR